MTSMSEQPSNKQGENNRNPWLVGGLVTGGVAILASGYYAWSKLQKRFTTDKVSDVTTGKEEIETSNDGFIKTVNGIKTAIASDKLLGNLGDMSKHGSLHEYIRYLTMYCGKIGAFYWGTTKVVYIASGDLKEQLNKSKLYYRPRMLFEGIKAMVGASSVQYINGDEFWTRFHDILRLYFGVKNLGKFEGILLQCMNNLLNKWQKDCESENKNQSDNDNDNGIDNGEEKKVADTDFDSKISPIDENKSAYYRYERTNSIHSSIIIDDVTDAMFRLSGACIISIIAGDAISNDKEFSSIVDTMVNGYFICWAEMERLLLKSEPLNEELFNKMVDSMKKCETMVNKLKAN